MINPAGVLFGEGARLNVEGSFHVSSADFVRSSDGKMQFFADPRRESSLKTAAVAGFGFLADPSNISVKAGHLAVSPDKTLSLIGGDIGVKVQGRLEAKGGRINVVSVASNGEVGLNTVDQDKAPRPMSTRLIPLGRSR